MTAEHNTIEAQIELAAIAMRAGIDGARRAIAEIEGFSAANSFSWPHSVCETSKVLADYAMRIHKYAAIVESLQSARALINTK
jgi:hypothetical protein